ncbi:hypothetical protein EW146_g9984 [Bondarzewia mesenterica]|uniref:Uncharacterized protein n=1 Tax=Bondarzewia mesenterica TaxID=1095465 RepID=A0A4V3XCB0_9AGAM|nr:hypothetical protein EW146_g9984 [Bondarzewia mesenterica]
MLHDVDLADTVLIQENINKVEYVWAGPWSLGKILFMANRYSPFIDTFISLHRKSLDRLRVARGTVNLDRRRLVAILFSELPNTRTDMMNPSNAWPNLKLSRVSSAFRSPRNSTDAELNAVMITIGTLISEAILMLRTYAIWNRERWVQIVLISTVVLVFPPAITVTWLEVTSLEYVPMPSPDLPGCRLGKASRIIYAAYVLLMLSETMIVTLTGVRAVQHLRATRSPTVVTLYRDGVLFYVYLFIITLLNVIVPAVAPLEFTNWLAT